MLRVLLVSIFLSAPSLSTEPAISADSLRGHVSFLASDLLEGRDTPSRGLDLAAAYIAAQFRRAGLETVTGEGYFQTANWTQRREDPNGRELRLHFADRIIRVAGSQLTVRTTNAVSIEDASVVRARFGHLDKLRADNLRQAILVIEIPNTSEMGNRERRRFARNRRELDDRLRELMPALVLLLDPSTNITPTLQRPVLVDPANPPPDAPPIIAVADAEVAEMFHTSSMESIRVSANCAPAIEEPAPLHNVVGLLRGSDPGLAAEAVMVTAHYDHVGLTPPAEEDRVNNGANDNASGAAAVIEIAAAFSKLEDRPRRSILFVTFFGEEKGLLGAGYYVQHPVVPLDKTVAAINFEHLGRTDSSEGPQLRRATITGFNYSNVAEAFLEAGKQSGVEFYRHAEYSRAFFNRSDNIRLAEKGVPSHTIAAAFSFPDYHAPGDEWEKLDYENMAAVTEAIAAGIRLLADGVEPPQWAPNSDYQRPDKTP